MCRKSVLTGLALVGGLVSLLSLLPAPALANSWSYWRSATVGSPVSAVGTLDVVSVSYSGEVIAGSC